MYIIDVVPYQGDRYRVPISVPPWSGVARMVIAATGAGTAGSVGAKQLDRHGFLLFNWALSRFSSGRTISTVAWGVRWGVRRAVPRPIAIIGGMIAPNESVAEIHDSTNLRDGTPVEFVVLYIPNALRAGSQNR